MATVDLTVRGAGIFGLSVAWAAVRRGARVRVIDPGGPGAGASGGLVGALAPHTPENWNPKKTFQLESLLMAGAFWADIDTASGLSSGYGRTGRVQPLADEAQVARARERAAGAEALWQGQASWAVVPAAELPWAPETATGLVIHDTLTARLHPAGACASLAGALAAEGAAIMAEGPDEGAVVWATGAAGLKDLSEALGETVGNGVKGQAALLAFDARDWPQLYADGLHIVPHADGTTAIGSTSERDFTDGATTDGQLDAVIARARAAVPALAGAPVLRRWAGIRPRARSRAPMLGAWPGRAGHFIANGGFKIGFGMAPLVGEVMADLVLNGVDRIPEGFRVADNLRG